MVSIARKVPCGDCEYLNAVLMADHNGRVVTNGALSIKVGSLEIYHVLSFSEKKILEDLVNNIIADLT